MKSLTNFLYVAIIGLLFVGFVGLLEMNKARTGLGVFKSREEVLQNRWIVADAFEKSSNKSLSDNFKSLSWQFLGSGGFVVFREQLIEQTGRWSLQGQELRIRKEGEKGQEKYTIDYLNQQELLLSSAQVKIRLLKLDD